MATVRIRCAWCRRHVELEAQATGGWRSPFESRGAEYVCVMCRSQFTMPSVREEFRVLTPPPALPAAPPEPRPWWKRLLRIG